ncbi:hypothetical protein D9M70_595470 [compost metagenome]
MVWLPAAVIITGPSSTVHRIAAQTASDSAVLIRRSGAGQRPCHQAASRIGMFRATSVHSSGACRLRKASV